LSTLTALKNGGKKINYIAKMVQLMRVLMAKNNGGSTEKNFPKQSGSYAPEIRNKETGGLYYDHSAIYGTNPDLWETYPTSSQGLLACGGPIRFYREAEPLDEINPDPFQRPANIATGDCWHLITGPTRDSWSPLTAGPAFLPVEEKLDPFELFDEGESPKEKVNHPAHYNAGKIEVIDAIEDWGLDFIEGNVVKYITRSKHKGNTLGDLRKARWYLDYRIAKLNDKKE